MNIEVTAVKVWRAMRPARDRADLVTEKATDDAAGGSVDELSDRAIRSIEDRSAPVGGPEYTGRA